MSDTLVTNEEGGRKYDGDKLRYDLLPPGPIRQLVEVLTYGSKKYDDNNWMKVEPQRYVAALMRHLEAWREGEQDDQETSFSHLAHAMCCLTFLMYLDEVPPEPIVELDRLDIDKILEKLKGYNPDIMPMIPCPHNTVYGPVAPDPYDLPSDLKRAIEDAAMPTDFGEDSGPDVKRCKRCDYVENECHCADNDCVNCGYQLDECECLPF